MACMSIGKFTLSGTRTVRVGQATRQTVVRNKLVVRASVDKPASNEVVKVASLGVAASALFASGNAYASQEILNLAASDNRFGLLTLLALPVVGWVAFNIGGPALNQLDNMSDSKKMIPIGLGLASLFAAQQADAAQQIADFAASDNRFGILTLLALPVIGWVAFNIGGPALNQLDNMSDSKKMVPIAAGVGLASLLAAQQADAAQQIADFAASDNRFGLLLLLGLPVLGWVAFNIAGPAFNQLDNMSGSKKIVPFGLGLGLGASLLATQQADAAQMIADMAEKDNRVGLLLLLGVPVIGWVGFNILGPALNQLDNMDKSKK